jgi:hypothetical protein
LTAALIRGLPGWVTVNFPYNPADVCYSPILTFCFIPDTPKSNFSADTTTATLSASRTTGTSLLQTSASISSGSSGGLGRKVSTKRLVYGIVGGVVALVVFLAIIGVLYMRKRSTRERHVGPRLASGAAASMADPAGEIINDIGGDLEDAETTNTSQHPDTMSSRSHTGATPPSTGGSIVSVDSGYMDPSVLSISHGRHRAGSVSPARLSQYVKLFYSTLLFPHPFIACLNAVLLG